MRNGAVAYVRFAALQVAVCVGLAFWAGTASAQMHSSGGAAAAGALVTIMTLVFAAFYVYTALCLQVIARKTNTANGWLAWIPIANVFLMLNIAQKPAWWFLLLLVPVVNVVIAVIVWMKIAKARSKAEWWGIMVIVPVMNVIAPGYLAFSE